MYTLVAPPDGGSLNSLLTAIKPLVPIPLLLVILPALWWFFRDTWRELDADATRWRNRLVSEGRSDFRPFVALSMCAVILTLQEYYGGHSFYDVNLRPILHTLETAHPRAVRVAKYD